MTEMHEIGAALRDRMTAAERANFSIEKAGGAWSVKYEDEHGDAAVTSLRVEMAALMLARELGLR